MNDEFGDFSEIEKMDICTGIMFDALQFIKKLGLLEEFKDVLRKKEPLGFIESFIDLCAENKE